MSLDLPHGLIAYGPHANCTLEICPVHVSVLGYRPAIPASVVFIALFGVSLLLHCVQGLHYRAYFFSLAIATGCIAELIGDSGRIILHNNPFGFSGFMVNIICIAIAPIFFCAAVYVTLGDLVRVLGPQYARAGCPPKIFYWAFIPCDIISLVLQAAGGASSSSHPGESPTGVDVSLAGLPFQVVTLFVFTVLSVDFLLRYHCRSQHAVAIPRQAVQFLVFLSLAIVLILIRCCYRIDELRDGYSGSEFRNESLFIGLESSLMVVASFCLLLAYPQPAICELERQICLPNDD